MREEDPASWVQARQGIAHSSILRQAGFTEHAVRTDVACGRLRRIRRSWLVTPDCDERRVRAAAAGGRPTCVTAAALSGLWDVPSGDVHVWVPRTASRFEHAGLRVHSSLGPVPVPVRAAEEPIVNVLFQVAACLPPGDALAIWESAVRREHVDVDVLERVRWRSRRAGDLAAMVGGRSDSGKETGFLALMREIGIDVHQQVWVDGHPLDGLIGERLGVQIDGYAHHSSPRDRRRDLRADARLVLRGYTILRFDSWQIDHDPAHVQTSILNAVAQGLHLRR